MPAKLKDSSIAKPRENLHTENGNSMYQGFEPKILHGNSRGIVCNSHSGLWHVLWQPVPADEVA